MLTPKAVQQEAKGLQSLAAEGDILAGDAARGRTTSQFLRVHADELAKAARASATTLAAGRTPAARDVAALAQQLGRDLGRLAKTSDHAELRRLTSRLARAADRAKKLGS